MKLKILTLFLILVAAFIAFSRTNRDALAPAADFPRGALVYVRINDLPALIKLWNESDFKEKYAASENFRDFTNNHLGRKLASRWTEFNQASGFPIDLETVAGLSENRAAIALYDIGKLEFVFIAPVSDDIFTATKFVQNRDKFEEETLTDGTIVYRAAVEAERGRQKQELIFANVRGRFVLATSEKLLARTLENIAGKKTKNSLSDEPVFAALRDKIEPHAATVWVNQTALDDDYYFKHYWLMANSENLKNLRAGIFDFEIETKKLVERRRFLLNKTAEVAPIENARAAELLSFLPENIPLYRLQTANSETIDEAVKTTIFERLAPEEKQNTNSETHRSSLEDDGDYSENNYENLSGKFDEAITEFDEDDVPKSLEANINFSKFLLPANPKAVLTFAAPQMLSAPMFVQFNRAAIFSLTSDADFNGAAFEAAITQKISAQTMISAPGAQLNWETKTADNLSWRELMFPTLGIEICYRARGRELILTNDADFLRNILSGQNQAEVVDLTAPITQLTMVNLNQRKVAYDSIFAKLTENQVADNFFTGNITSLLDSVSKAGKIEVREYHSRDFFEEELIMNFR